MVYFKPSKEFYKDVQRLFLDQKKRVLKLLPFAKIRHIGSTALPNAITKGDLDIIITVPEKYFKKSISKLKTIYDTHQLANWENGFASFKDDKSFKVPFGAQLISPSFKKYDFIKHTRMFKRNHKLLLAYNRLKLKYDGKTMREYRKAKKIFFETIDPTD